MSTKENGESVNGFTLKGMLINGCVKIAEWNLIMNKQQLIDKANKILNQADYDLLDWQIEKIMEIVASAYDKGREYAYNKTRNKIWKLMDEYHDPHDELETPCSEGADALNDVEAFVIDKLSELKEK